MNKAKLCGCVGKHEGVLRSPCTYVRVFLTDPHAIISSTLCTTCMRARNTHVKGAAIQALKVLLSGQITQTFVTT